MSYREENDQVILTMSRDEYDQLLFVFATATTALIEHHLRPDVCTVLLNRLNEGNPHYTPYQVKPYQVKP